MERLVFQFHLYKRMRIHVIDSFGGQKFTPQKEPALEKAKTKLFNATMLNEYVPIGWILIQNESQWFLQSLWQENEDGMDIK